MIKYLKFELESQEFYANWIKLACGYKAQRNSGWVVPPERSRRAALCKVLLLCSTVITTFPFFCPFSTYR